MQFMEEEKIAVYINNVAKIRDCKKIHVNAFILVLQPFMQNKIDRLCNLIFTFVSFSEITIFTVCSLQKEWPSSVSLDEPYCLVETLQKD